jgi:signal peptidase
VAPAATIEERKVPPAAAPSPWLSEVVGEPGLRGSRRSPGLTQRVLLRLLGVTATLVVVVALAALAAAAIGPRLGLYRTETVLSGSMRPAFSPGDVIVVTPEPTAGVRVGQVISYQIPIGDHHVESHRVIKLAKAGDRPIIETKGDANTAPDPWRARLTPGTAWRERFVIPKLGWLIIWLRQPLAQSISVLLLPMLLAAWWLVRIWRPRPQPSRAAS